LDAWAYLDMFPGKFLKYKAIKIDIKKQFLNDRNK